MSTPKSQKPPSGIELELDNAIGGLQSGALGNVSSITLAGIAYTVPALIQKAQTIEQPWTTVRSARDVIRAAMATRPMDLQTARAFLSNLKAAISSAVGTDSQTLRKFGWTPRTPRKKMTSQQGVIRAAKASLTRSMRHTQGSRQKAAVKNTSTPVVTIAPDGTLIAPPATSVSVTPASSGKASP